jgi:hypothetical protein
VTGERVRPAVAQLRELAAHQRLALGGAAAAGGAVEAEGVLMLTGDPIAESVVVTTLVRGDRDEAGEVTL